MKQRRASGDKIDRVDYRKTLPSADTEPYWKRLEEGRHIGYRPASETWIARAYDGERYAYHPLGGFADVPEKNQYAAAKRKAEVWFKHLDQGGSTEPHTVKAACEAYVEKLRLERSEDAAKNAEGFFRRLVDSDPIAEVQLSKLTRPDMSAWRKRLLEKNNDRASFNRNVTPLRAALNLAHQEGKVASDQAWLAALKPFKGAGNRRTLYLDRAKRRALVEGASDESRPLFKAMALLPMRPGELAALKVEHLKVDERVLEIPTGKTEARVIPLEGEALAHFKECAKGKLPAAWLLSRADGSQWDRFAWRDEMKLAAARARLPEATVAYTLRHSIITDLVSGGLDLFHVAKLAGTSIAMIEKHYGQLQREHVRKALAQMAL